MSKEQFIASATQALKRLINFSKLPAGTAVSLNERLGALYDNIHPDTHTYQLGLPELGEPLQFTLRNHKLWVTFKNKVTHVLDFLPPPPESFIAAPVMPADTVSNPPAQAIATVTGMELAPTVAPAVTGPQPPEHLLDPTQHHLPCVGLPGETVYH